MYSRTKMGMMFFISLTIVIAAAWFTRISHAQLPDHTVTPNTAGVGINKSFSDQAGAGRGDVMTPNSSRFIIERDPFRAIRRGRQLFQRKYTRLQGIGPWHFWSGTFSPTLRGTT